LDSDTLETSYGHKKKEDGEHEVPLSKLSKVSHNKQTIKGRQALNEMTMRATNDIPVKVKKRKATKP
jgi:hypothetical protein